MKIAIIHYWLVRMRGGEKVIEALCELYPDADIFTHVVDQENISETILSHKVTKTFVSKLPFATKWYKNYLPFMPLALEQLDLSDYDLIISSESGPTKGVITRPDALHICYCHTPMRYVWDMYHQYRKDQFFLKRWLMTPLLHYIRNWDFISSARVDHYVANSNYVAKRIKKYYRRDATVINPPVETARFETDNHEKSDYYLLFGQLVTYKRADLAIEAFNQSGKSLIVIGNGEMKEQLLKLAKPNINFKGWLNDDEITEYLQGAKALIFPGVEDFGIIPLEAMASGTPVIAYAEGGALETVIDQKTGILFEQQTSDCLNNAIDKFETCSFNKDELIYHASKFSSERFKQQIKSLVDQLYEI